MRLKGKTVLVTGGGSGIGLAIARALREKKADVIICGRSEDKLIIAQKSNPGLDYKVCDVTDAEQINTLVRDMEKENGGIDILINNAGIFTSFDYQSGSPSLEEQIREIDIDFTAALKMIHMFLPVLKTKPEAAVVNVTSALALVPLTLAPVYCASKAALHSWTRSFRFQMQNTNIKVFELMPPLVETPMVKDFEGQKMMSPGKLAEALIKGLENNTYQINPGQSGQMKIMSRLAPAFIFKTINKQFGG